MKNLFENWQNYLQEDSEEKTDKPKVVCNCLCTDCIFNKSEQCITEEINLDFAQTKQGKWICECLTYEVDEGKEKGPEDSTVRGREEVDESAWSGSGPLKEPIEEM